MSRKKASNSSFKENSNSNVTVIIAVIGLLGTIVTAYFGYLANTKPSDTEISIFATQTAEAKLTAESQDSSNANSVTAIVGAKKFDVIVSATSGWFDTGITVSSGEILNISASGTAFIAPSSTSSARLPDGMDDSCSPDCLLDNVPYGTLIGRIDTNAPFLIGSSSTIKVPQNIESGPLYPAINDSKKHYFDNSGEFQVTVNIR